MTRFKHKPNLEGLTITIFIMENWFQEILIDPFDKENMEFWGDQDEDKLWWNGTLKNVKTGIEYPVLRGIPNFVPKIKATWEPDVNSRDSTILDNVTQIRNNWIENLDKLSKNVDHYFFKTIQQIASAGGLILDVASGPGGGCTTPILYTNPEASLIMSDLGIRVLLRWQEFLQKEGSYHNVRFISLDATNLPIRSESIDFVVDSGGFGNVKNSERALEEACRVLKSGGMLFLNDAETEGVNGFPQAVREKWFEEFSHMQIGWTDLVESSGLDIVERKTYSRRPVLSTESDLGQDAKDFDVKVNFLGQSIKAIKP